MKNKLIFLAFLVLFASFTLAHTVGSEVNSNVIIDENNFAYTHIVETNERFYLKIRIIDVNNNALTGTHLHFLVEDNRGAIIKDYTEEIISGNIIKRLISDQNGFINFSFFAKACDAIQQDFCYRPDQNYTFRITQNNLDRQEQFGMKIQNINNDFIGNGMRWIVINIETVFILGFILLVLVLVALAIIAIFFRRGK